MPVNFLGRVPHMQHPSAPTTASPAALPRATYMTYVLIALNVAVFFILQSNGGPTYENLLLFGAKENGLIAEGQVGRLIFPMFLHANALHLGFNMWGLYQVGRYLELMIGPRKLVLLYFIAGITGNLASFAFSKPLSVGASGALFGFLATLWILQKYEERLALEMNEPVQKSTLGMLILFNFVLGFVIANIDWACHLGGFLAGGLFGLALVMRHRLNSRILSAARFVGHASTIKRPRFFEREGFYVSLMVLLNLLLSLGYFRVDVVARAFGLGTLAAAENLTDPKPPDMLPQFRMLLASPKSEGHPESLLAGAIALHGKGHFLAAALTFDVLLTFNEYGLGGEAFVSQTTRATLLAARKLAMENEVISDDLVAAFGPLADTRKAKEAAEAGDPKVCLEPAGLLRTLGFFGLAGRLYECAFSLDTSQLQTGADTFECYSRADGEEKMQTLRFRYFYESLVSHADGAIRRQERSDPKAFPMGDE